MRELKFRAWHAMQKKMYSAEEMGADQLTLSVDGRGFVNVGGIDTRLSIFAGEKMVPLQYTGLHDKNGKEIYEGDVCKADNKAVGTIVWHNDRFTWTDGACHWNLIFDKDDGPLDEDISVASDLKVIGNIYETPELLAETNLAKTVADFQPGREKV